MNSHEKESEDLVSALLVFLASLCLLLLASPFLAPLGLWGIILAQLLFIAGPAFLYQKQGVQNFSNFAKKIRLKKAPPSTILGGVFIGVALLIANLAIISPLSIEVFGKNAREEELFQQLISSEPFWLIFLSLALMPAICEEFLVRGTLLPAIKERSNAITATLLSSILFGAMHFSAMRFLPTTFIGVFLALTFISSKNLVIAMIAHLCNNGTALLLSELGSLGTLNNFILQYPFAAIFTSIVLFLLGFRLIATQSTEKKLI